ncbi:MAG: DUF2125 domain-containing protein [Roseicyclus sp.]|uniref:DUF2125 domain-containing protein n=1 Tax=Roseicyclus sp. TaxID=1914329 RepID=UPI003A84F200
MPNVTAPTLTLSALALFLATPAMAVTAEELWAEWQSQAAALGQTMTADEVVPGNGTLTLRGFRTTFADEDVATVGRLEQIVMTEAGDGSVSIDLSDVYEITITFEDLPGAPPVNLGVNVIMPDLAMTASGDAGARLYAYSASRITIEDGPITGGNGAPPTIDMMIGIDSMTATYEIDGSNPENIAYVTDTQIGGVAGALDILPPPGEEGSLKLVFSLGATTASGAGRLGNLAALAAAPDTIPTDFAINGDFTYADASMDLTFAHPRDAFQVFASNAGGSMSATVSDSLVDYRITATGSATHFASPELPVPVDFSVGSAEIAFSLPLAAAAAPQPMSARLAYRDVTVGPQVWAMADPAGSFPRDPITVIADLTGSLQILTDLMAVDPTDMGAPPAELRDVTLNELQLSVGGASLTGTGSATFAPGPIPMPVGSVNLQLAGGNALMDRLQASGLVPIEQIAMARGLLGAFTRPGATPDTLETTIQFTEGGGISANGVPLQ